MHDDEPTDCENLPALHGTHEVLEPAPDKLPNVPAEHKEQVDWLSSELNEPAEQLVNNWAPKMQYAPMGQSVQIPVLELLY